jgi:N-acetyl-anhydromuramyl-L-alanine amidase AmpD
MVARPDIKWIGTGSVPKFYPGRKDASGRIYRPVAIVMHIMQGTLAGTDSYFQQDSTQASTNFGIGKNGEIHQYVDLKDGAWGNGKVANPNWGILSQFPGVNPNLFTISVEHEGFHDLTKGDFYQFTDAQYEADIKLVAYLCDLYMIPCDRDHIVGHYQIDGVSRAFCPGPTYDFDRVINGAKALLDATPEPAPVLKAAPRDMLTKADADKIVTLLGALWGMAVSETDRKEYHRLANEVRKASGQEVIA